MEREFRRVIDSLYDQIEAASSAAAQSSSSSYQGTSSQGTNSWQSRKNSPTQLPMTSQPESIPVSGSNSLDAIRAALQNTGSHPMNVRGLHGELNAPQKARTQLYTANLPPVGQSLIEGQLAWFDGTMYAYIPGTPGSWEPVGGQTGNMFLYGPYAGRPATALDGTIYFATDRQVAWQWRETASPPWWWYIFGTHGGYINTKPTLTPITDEGYLFYAYDYGHLWKGQSGGFYNWGPGELGSRYLRFDVDAPDFPTDGWALCDGNTYMFSTAGATTYPFSTPRMSSEFWSTNPDWQTIIFGTYLKAGPNYEPMAGGTMPILTGFDLLGEVDPGVKVAADANGISVAGYGHEHYLTASVPIAVSMIPFLRR